MESRVESYCDGTWLAWIEAMHRNIAISLGWCLMIVMFMVVVVTSMSGCSTTPFETPEQVRANSTDHTQGARSLTLDSPRLRRTLAQADRSGDLDPYPWYASRNDARLTVENGTQGPTSEWSQTITWDHQYISGNNQPRDYYYQSTFRARVTQTAR